MSLLQYWFSICKNIEVFLNPSDPYTLQFIDIE